MFSSSLSSQKVGRFREPTTNEILNTHNFNKLVYKDTGLYFHGKDEDGNKVYTMGRGRSKILVPGVFNLIDMLIEEEVFNEKSYYPIRLQLCLLR